MVNELTTRDVIGGQVVKGRIFIGSASELMPVMRDLHLLQLRIL